MAARFAVLELSHFMKRILIVLSLFVTYSALAQEVLSPLGFNPRLYYSAAQPHRSSPRGYKDYVLIADSNTLIESDTLALPFVDDFTYSTLKPYNYSGYIYATIHNAIGPCDSVWGVHTVTDTFSLSASYTFTYNTTTHKVDSALNSPIVFLNSPGFTGNCFNNLGDTAFLYPLTYIDVFDTITGAIIAQIRDTTNVKIGITYAPTLYKSKAPLHTKWLDNFAYQNSTMGYLPPSIGVATFDGLNDVGQPYDKSNPTNWGRADVLTSKPLGLDGLTDADSVYLSFFYQPGGFGDPATSGDSLVLEFYNGYTNGWDHIWSVAGDTVIPSTPDAFKQVVIRIPTTSNAPSRNYMFKGFHFRFANYGSLTGNNDIWNLDYVRLDKNRTVTDTSISDLAFQYNYPSILKNYSEMPAWQFNDTFDLTDSVVLYIDNLNPTQASSNPPATSFTISAHQSYPSSSVVMAPLTNTFNANVENMVFLAPSLQYTIPSAGAPDSIVITSSAVLNINDLLTGNDSISKAQTLTDVLAYDDGSAELTYGVQYLGVKKFAYDFTLHHPDSLVGFQVLYSNTDVNVHDLVFNFNLWYRLDTQNVFFADTPVYVSNNQTPFYIDSVNGFATYKIAPMALPTHFYFGYSQTDTRNLQIGYDVNSTKGRPHMFIYSSTSGVWKKSNLYTNGSPMIRLLLGHTYQVASGIKNISMESIKAYPNPTTGLITFELPDHGSSYQAELYNTIGQMSINQTINASERTINISSLAPGIYLLRLTDTATGVVYQNKIVKSAKE